MDNNVNNNTIKNKNLDNNIQNNIAEIQTESKSSISQPEVFNMNAEQNSTKPKKKNSAIFVVLILVIGIGIGGFFLFKKSATNPKKVINASVNTLFEKALKIEKEIKEKIKFDYKKDALESNGAMELSVSGLEKMSSDFPNPLKLSINYDVNINLPQKELYADLTYLEDNNKIINSQMLLKNKDMYLKLDEIENGLFSIPVPEEINIDEIFDQLLDTISTENYIKMIRKLKTYIINSIKDEYLTQKKGSYTVDNTTINGIRTSIDISEVRLINIENSILRAMIADEEFLDIYTKLISNIEKEEFKKYMEEYLKMNEEAIPEASSEITSSINVYISNTGKFLAFDVVSAGKTYLTSVEKKGVNTIKLNIEIPTFNSEDLNCMDENDTDCFENSLFDFKPITAVLTLDSNNKIAKFEVNNISAEISEIIDGYKFNFKSDDMNISGSYKEQYKNKTQKNEIEISFEQNYEIDNKKNKINVSLKANSNTNVIDQIKSFDISKAKKVEELTEQEGNKLLEDLYAKLENSKMIKMIIENQEAASNELNYNY